MGRFSGKWNIYWPYFGFAAIGVALAVWEGLEYLRATTGTMVTARVDDCRIDPVKARAVTCVGHWPVGPATSGDVPRGHGVIGNVNLPDLYKTVAVHVHGGTVYAQRLTAGMVVFFVVGVLFAGAWVYAAWRKAAPERTRSAAGLHTS